MKTVLVKTNLKTYPVHIGENIFQFLPKYLDKQNHSKRVFVILDDKIAHIYRKLIKKVINSFADKNYYFSIDPNENIKSFKSIDQIISKLYEEGFGRDTLLIAIGGGIVGDVSGFVASIYMRGISLVHIPTTLLSAVDSSIGGKTGINYRDAKNLIGTFYHPELVLVDTNFLKSLPNEEMISGFGEVIKYSYLIDKKFYSTLLSNYHLVIKKNVDFLNKIIYECVKIKSAVISKDENELTGLRKILNFGHTFAHAFETNSSYKISHGKAVIAGIVSALFLSHEKQLIDRKQLDIMLELPLKFQSSIKINNFSSETIFRLMAHDKKNREGKLQFVLIKSFGEILIDISTDKKSVIKSLEQVYQIRFKRATAGL